MNNTLFGYKQRHTWLNQTTGTAKLVGFFGVNEHWHAVV